VLVGAGLLLVVIDAAITTQDREPRAQVMAVMRFTLIGALFLFLLREAYDLVVLGELAQGLERNLRWMLSFIGYFTTAVATFFALAYHRQMQVARAKIAEMQVTINPTNKGVEYQEVVAFLTSLQAQASYECADLDVRPKARLLQQRRDHIDQLLTRLNDAKPT
jgi:hypothetical protein